MPGRPTTWRGGRSVQASRRPARLAPIWLPEAKADIQRLFDFLVEVNLSAAAAAMRVILAGAARLLEHPKIGRRMDDETPRRELVLPFAPAAYVLRYRIGDDAIVIVRA